MAKKNPFAAFEKSGKDKKETGKEAGRKEMMADKKMMVGMKGMKPGKSKKC